MDFTAKLARLVAGKNKSDVGRRAGLPATAINDYLQKGNVPRADNALALARSLDVSLTWLVDDARDEMPPPRFGDDAPPPSDASDDSLLREVARRFRLSLVDFMGESAKLRALDWKRLADAVKGLSANSGLPPEVDQAVKMIRSFDLRYNQLLQDYDVDFYVRIHHADLPGSDRKLADVDVHRVHDSVATDPHVNRFVELVRPLVQESPSIQSRWLDEYEIRSRKYHASHGDAGRAEKPATRRRGKAAS